MRVHAHSSALKMKPPRAYARGILHFFGEIRRSTLLSPPAGGFGGSARRIHPLALWPWSSAKADKSVFAFEEKRGYTTNHMGLRIVKTTISKRELQDIATPQFGIFVKAVVDIEQKIMAIGGELHADLEVVLTEKEGSKRDHTWGINLYPGETGDAFIEFDSMINIKPTFGNKSRGVEDLPTQELIRAVIQKLVAV